MEKFKEYILKQKELKSNDQNNPLYQFKTENGSSYKIGKS
jgi:hypothetical protein